MNKTCGTVNAASPINVERIKLFVRLSYAVNQATLMTNDTLIRLIPEIRMMASFAVYCSLNMSQIFLKCRKE